MVTKVGIAGLGAIGRAVLNALNEGIEGHSLVAVSEQNTVDDLNVPNAGFDELIETSDLVVECLPPVAAAELAQMTLSRDKDIIMISSCALLMFPEILEKQKASKSRIFVPSGALAGLDGVKALKSLGIESTTIASTKPPRGFQGAPFVVENDIDLENIHQKTRIFAGNALEAARGFPANVNVAATLSLAAHGPEQTQVEIWADPDARGNSHEITVNGTYSTITARIDNTPDPNNPKSSMLAAHSIIAALKDRNSALVVL